MIQPIRVIQQRVTRYHGLRRNLVSLSKAQKDDIINEVVDPEKPRD